MRGDGHRASKLSRVEADGYKGEDMGFVGLGQRETIFTRQIDQVSRERSKERVREGIGVDPDTRM